MRGVGGVLPSGVAEMVLGGASRITRHGRVEHHYSQFELVEVRGQATFRDGGSCPPSRAPCSTSLLEGGSMALVSNAQSPSYGDPS